MTNMTQANQKRYDDEDLQPFFQLQKSQVLHEAKAFNETPLDARKCCSVVTELLCLLSQGETLGSEEATTLFFGVTKLFQSDDPQLRRLVYLVIKELNQDQDQAFIVLASLEKDINGQIDLFRANAIRVHSKVIDTSMLEQRARLFRQAIVNSNEHIASAALTSGINLFIKSPEVIRRWVNEVRESCRSSKPMVSFHGLHLLYKIHESDRRGVMRLVSNFIKNPPESPYAKCLLIRYAFSVLSNNTNENNKSLVNFIKNQIKTQYKTPMVTFEAAKAISYMPNASDIEIMAAMTVLQEFLGSPRPVVRFAAVRALSNIVTRFPSVITPSCTVDLEHLITDSNRNIATLAITTLLKTTAEYSIERLLNSISDFMQEITDELKIVLIDSIKLVCKKFPNKYDHLVSFLSMALREEGGFSYKNKVVDCMLILMNSLERAKAVGLDSLCEFIEDSEYPQLSVRILHIIGELGPTTQRPSRYIRFIFNRVLLELPSVRAAAISCLTQFAIKDPSLEKDIRILLKRSFDDFDDEVRDRATLYDTLLKHCQYDSERIQIKQNKLLQNESELNELNDSTINENSNIKQREENDLIIINNETTNEEYKSEYKESESSELSTETRNRNIKPEISPKPENLVAANDIIGLLDVPSFEDFKLGDLEYCLLGYIESNNKLMESEEKETIDKAFEEGFNINKVIEYSKSRVSESDESKKPGSVISPEVSSIPDNPYLPSSDMNSIDNEAYELFLNQSGIKEEINNLGKELCHSNGMLLTEPELEYQVEIIKHIYEKYIILQCNLLHRMEDKIFADAYVELDYDDSEVQTVQCPMLKSNDSGMSLIVIVREEFNEELETSPFLIGIFDCALKFKEKDATVDNPEFEEGFDEVYSLNELELNIKDYIISINDISIIEFKRKWKEMENVCSKIQKQGKMKNNELQESVDIILNKVGLTPVEGSDKVKEEAPTHVANLIGTLTDETPILMRAAFAQDGKETSYRIALRCPNEIIGKTLVNEI